MKLVFWLILSSPALIAKLIWDGIYAIGKVPSSRNQMPKLKEGKKMSRGESVFHFSKNIICCKWYNNKPVLLLATNIDAMNGVSNAMRWLKGSATKTLVSCPKIIKLYNNGMDESKNICLQTRSSKLVSLLLKHDLWSHRCRASKQSYCLSENW